MMMLCGWCFLGEAHVDDIEKVDDDAFLMGLKEMMMMVMI